MSKSLHTGRNIHILAWSLLCFFRMRFFQLKPLGYYTTSPNSASTRSLTLTFTLCESQHGLRAPLHSMFIPSPARGQSTEQHCICMQRAACVPEAESHGVRAARSRITMFAGPTARWQEALSARPRASKSQSRTNPKSHNPPDPRDPWAPGPTGLWTLQRLLFSTKGAPGL